MTSEVRIIVLMTILRSVQLIAFPVGQLARAVASLVSIVQKLVNQYINMIEQINTDAYRDLQLFWSSEAHARLQKCRKPSTFCDLLAIQ